MRASVFAIQKGNWTGACECAIFVKTTNAYVTTGPGAVLFAPKPPAMLQECKRLVNKSAPCRGILVPQLPAEDAVQLDGAFGFAVADQSAASSVDAAEHVGESGETATATRSPQLSADATGPRGSASNVAVQHSLVAGKADEPEHVREGNESGARSEGGDGGGRCGF